MADIYDLVGKFRGNLLAGEAKAASTMIQQYSRSLATIDADLQAVALKVERAVAEGQPVKKAWETQRRQLEGLRRQTLIQISDFADDAYSVTLAHQKEAVQAAATEAPELLANMKNLAGGAHGRPLARLDDQAVERIVGALQAGSPLREVLGELPIQAEGAMYKALRDSIAAGLGPREAVRRVRGSLDGVLARALTITRTETMRAYRTATLETYAQNGVDEWEWVCAKSNRTCACCWALDGRKFPTSDGFMKSHPNCRCTAIPAVSVYDDPEVDTRAKGRDAFDKLPDADKRRVLGPAGYDAYAQGKVDLGDFVAFSDSQRWGGMYRKASLKDALAAHEAKAEATDAVQAALVAKKEKEKAQAAARAKAYRDRKRQARAGADTPEPQYPFDPARLTPDAGEGSGLGGAHTKMVYRDENGKAWLFKPQDEFRAQADVATARLQRLSGLTAPDTHVIRINGRVGSIQELLAEKAERRVPFQGGFDPLKMDAQGVQQIQRHHSFDWLIGNHDAHSEQFIRKAGSRELIGIDKGQAFKFFDTDRLDWRYNPNQQFIGDDHVYNLLHGRYAAGDDVAMDLIFHDTDAARALRRHIDTIQAIPDDEYRAILRPYAEARHALGPGNPAYLRDVDDFLNRAVIRKQRLKRDITEFHDTLEAARKLALKPRAPNVTHKGMGAGRRFTTDSEGTTWAHQHLGPAARASSAAEKKALRSYQNGSYHVINRELRNGKGNIPATMVKETREQVAEMDRMIGRMEIPEDVILHRGTNHISVLEGDVRRVFDAHGNVNSLVGKLLVEDGFMSTSVGTSAAFSHTNIILRIMTPSGTRGVFVNAIEDIGEREIVLERGLQLLVHKVEKVGMRWRVDVEVVGSARRPFVTGAPGAKPKRVRRPNKAPLKAKLDKLQADYQAGKIGSYDLAVKTDELLEGTGWTYQDFV